MKPVTTDITIDAPPEAVWEELMDFPKFPEWNPFIRSIEGDASVGETIDVVLGPQGKRPMNISPTVTEVVPNHRFAWTGSMITKGLFDGHHQFELIEADRGTLFRHSEDFSGVLAPIVLRAIRASTTQGFQDMNVALKSRLEKREHPE